MTIYDHNKIKFCLDFKLRSAIQYCRYNDDATNRDIFVLEGAYTWV